MTSPATTVTALVDQAPSNTSLQQAVLEGLAHAQKTLPTALLYDERGSELFDLICDQPEYYPTRTELSIMDTHLAQMAEQVGPEVMLLEYGSGTGVKTRRLLAELERPVAYVPIEISKEILESSAAALAMAFPELEVSPVCADFTQALDVPLPTGTPRRLVLYFPGSTIGNFRPDAASRLLVQMRNHVGADGGVLLGVDLKKDVRTLELAYNDAAGVTAAFNLNLLKRINTELGGDFPLDAFEHKAVWVAERSAIEMRLYATRASQVRVGSSRFTFESGEWIHTEDSHKYSLPDFAKLARDAQLEVKQVWTDPKQLFSVQYLEPA